MIEWKSRGNARELTLTVGSRIVDFTVHHQRRRRCIYRTSPEAEAVQNVYEVLGIGMLVRRREEPRLRFLLGTSRGDVILR